MVKKRKASDRVEQADTDGFEKKGGSMARINSYEDVADSEDEFHINRDKVMLEDGPDAKRRKKWEDNGDLSFIQWY